MNFRIKGGTKVHKSIPGPPYDRFFYQAACGKSRFERQGTITTEEVTCKFCLKIMVLREEGVEDKYAKTRKILIDHGMMAEEADDFIQGILRGLKDVKAGRVTPFSEIRRELGL